MKVNVRMKILLFLTSLQFLLVICTDLFPVLEPEALYSSSEDEFFSTSTIATSAVHHNALTGVNTYKDVCYHSWDSLLLERDAIDFFEKLITLIKRYGQNSNYVTQFLRSRLERYSYENAVSNAAIGSFIKLPPVLRSINGAFNKNIVSESFESFNEQIIGTSNGKQFDIVTSDYSTTQIRETYNNKFSLLVTGVDKFSVISSSSSTPLFSHSCNELSGITTLYQEEQQRQQEKLSVELFGIDGLNICGSELDAETLSLSIGKVDRFVIESSVNYNEYGVLDGTFTQSLYSEEITKDDFFASSSLNGAQWMYEEDDDDDYYYTLIITETGIIRRKKIRKHSSHTKIIDDSYLDDDYQNIINSGSSFFTDFELGNQNGGLFLCGIENISITRTKIGRQLLLSVGGIDGFKLVNSNIQTGEWYSDDESSIEQFESDYITNDDDDDDDDIFSSSYKSTEVKSEITSEIFGVSNFNIPGFIVSNSKGISFDISGSNTKAVFLPDPDDCEKFKLEISGIDKLEITTVTESSTITNSAGLSISNIDDIDFSQVVEIDESSITSTVVDSTTDIVETSTEAAATSFETTLIENENVEEKITIEKKEENDEDEEYTIVITETKKIKRKKAKKGRPVDDDDGVVLDTIISADVVSVAKNAQSTSTTTVKKELNTGHYLTEILKLDDVNK
ncbi:uncharacterized protein LOC142331929 [Lycorma delicatula]|uniref:uncharacterized protein LOC142331929 n=1 Tax=Lycorma delicatula TaxID=130591 RepID=UPI003F5145CE